MNATATDGCRLFWNCAAGIWSTLAYDDNVANARRLTDAVVNPNQMAIDDRYVYWTDLGGFIGRVPR